MTPRRTAVALSIAALMAVLIYLVATKNPLGGWILSYAVPALVVYGVVRRMISGHSLASAVRPAAQGVNEVQHMVLNCPGAPVAFGSAVTVATEHDPRFPDPLLDAPDARDRDTSTDRA